MRISAPSLRATLAMPSSSVETTIRSTDFAFFRARIAYEMRGLPFNFFIFFLGIRLDPPRAGTSASTVRERYMMYKECVARIFFLPRYIGSLKYYEKLFPALE